MSGENSCFSRFLVKFVEVSAAGLATAISAYALAHLGGSCHPLPRQLPRRRPLFKSVRPPARSPRACAPNRPRLLRPLPSTSRALRRSRTPMRPSRSPRVRPRRTRKHCRRASTQKPIRAWPRRSLAARHRRKPWPGPHSPMSTPIGRHQVTRRSNRGSPTLVLRRSTYSRVGPTCRRARRMSGRRRRLSQFLPALRVSRRPRIPSTFSRRRSSSPVRSPLSTSSRGRASASRRRRVPAKSRVRPCQSGQRRLK